ncbi:DUF3558 domain-containing protein [Gordonia sinesedis]
MTARRRAPAMLAALLLLAVALAGCARTVDGEAVAVGAADSDQEGNVDTDQFDKLTLECQVVSTAQIAKIVGGTAAEGTFNGAICRWLVDGPAAANVTFNWFEWGNLNVEKDTAKKLGYTTENIRVASQAAFTQRDPKRPAVCGVTTRAPSRGVYTWWVEPVGAAAADPCAAPTKLMELLLTGGQ